MLTKMPAKWSRTPKTAHQCGQLSNTVWLPTAAEIDLRSIFSRSARILAISSQQLTAASGFLFWHASSNPCHQLLTAQIITAKLGLS
jgi:hypothetical protein